MATPIVSDPATSINTFVPTKPDLSQISANDQLLESLDKAIALTFIFACSNIENYDTKTIQSFASAVLDNLYAANEALEFLWKRKQGFL